MERTPARSGRPALTTMCVPAAGGLFLAILLLQACGKHAGDDQAASSAPAPRTDSPAWAYAVPFDPAKPPAHEDGKLLSLAGSTRQFTRTDLRTENAAPRTIVGVADWFPQEHPPMPAIVALGDRTRDVRACGHCHMPNGLGRSESASLAGLGVAYIVRQLQDMAKGDRDTAEPLKTNGVAMITSAKNMTAGEMQESAAYFAALKYRRWIEVVETDTVPKTHSQAGMLLPVTDAKAGTEAIGMRIIEVPRDSYKTAVLRSPHDGFVAFVPKGAVARGQSLVATGVGGAGGCAACHGADLTGSDMAPPLAGRSPSYVARQLNDFQKGARHGPGAALMAPAAAGITLNDMVDISAYIASLPPKK